MRSELFVQTEKRTSADNFVNWFKRAVNSSWYVVSVPLCARIFRHPLSHSWPTKTGVCNTLLRPLMTSRSKQQSLLRGIVRLCAYLHRVYGRCRNGHNVRLTDVVLCVWKPTKKGRGLLLVCVHDTCIINVYISFTTKLSHYVWRVLLLFLNLEYPEN